MTLSYYAVTKKKNEHTFDVGTRLLRIQPSEDYGGSSRDYHVYSYRVQVTSEEVSGGPDDFRLLVKIDRSNIKFIERLMALSELWELEEKLSQSEEEDC